jgi:hypothetical protein
MRYPTPHNQSRLGFCYNTSNTHHRQVDLHRWLPKFESMGVGWLMLNATIERAIPEGFIRGLIAAGIEPVIHFGMSPATPPSLPDFRLLIQQYARWGIHYICLFDQPNLQAQWTNKNWAQTDLVERYLDVFIPLAREVIKIGMWPVFSPLALGGDYWDTAFLRTSMEALLRRGQTRVLDKLVLGAYANIHDYSLQWGAGGPERWIGARPYFTPDNEEDQKGFRVADWYRAITSAELGRSLPMILFETGQHAEIVRSVDTDRQIAQLLSGFPIQGLDPVDEDVLAFQFQNLIADSTLGESDQAFFTADGNAMKSAQTLTKWQAQHKNAHPQPKSVPVTIKQSTPNPTTSHTNFTIRHYVLLPKFEWGVSDWHLNAVRPFVKKHDATVGCSAEEAIHASRVTLVGDESVFPTEIELRLQQAGCLVERIDGTGTDIATKLAS